METIYDVLTGLEKIGQLTDMELEKRTGTRIEEEQCPEGLQLDLENITFFVSWSWSGNNKGFKPKSETRREINDYWCEQFRKKHFIIDFNRDV